MAKDHDLEALLRSWGYGPETVGTLKFPTEVWDLIDQGKHCVLALYPKHVALVGTYENAVKAHLGAHASAGVTGRPCLTLGPGPNHETKKTP